MKKPLRIVLAILQEERLLHFYEKPRYVRYGEARVINKS